MQNLSAILPIAPFNGVFWGVLVFFSIIILVLSQVLNKKSLNTQKKALLFLSFLNIAVYFVYKLMLSRDADYSALVAAKGEGALVWNWFDELPLEFCNIALILTPFAVLTRKRVLLSYVSVLAPLSAFLAILMPVTGFSGYGLFLPRIAGFYFTHTMLIATAMIILKIRFFTPEYRDILPVSVFLVILAACVFGINMLLRKTGLDLYANYFFTVEPRGNPILELAYSILPVPFLYMLLMMVIILPYLFGITWGIQQLKRLRKSDG